MANLVPTPKRTLFLTLFIITAEISFSQKKDFGIWYNIETEYQITKKLELELSTTIRTFENASKIEEAFLEGGVSYKFNNYFAVAASYRIIENIEDDGSYHLRHKWFIGATGSLPLGDFDLSGRLRFQKRYKTFYEDEDDKIPNSHCRFRLKLDYDTPTSPFNPYVSAEIFLPVFNEPGKLIDRTRFTAGVELKITNRSSAEGGFIYIRDYLPRLKDKYLVSLCYKFRF